MELLLDLGTGALAGLTFIAAVMIAGRVLGARDPARRDSGFWSSLLRISRSLHPVVAAGVLALCVAAFAVLGALVLVAEVPLEAFRVNVERRVPTLFSGILLLAAGAMALLAGRLALGGRSWAWLCLGVGLIALGFDEVAELHERFEARTDLPTVIIFAPLALPLLVAWLRTVPALSAHPRRWRCSCSAVSRGGFSGARPDPQRMEERARGNPGDDGGRDVRAGAAAGLEAARCGRGVDRRPRRAGRRLGHRDAGMIRASGSGWVRGACGPGARST